MSDRKLERLGARGDELEAAYRRHIWHAGLEHSEEQRALFEAGADWSTADTLHRSNEIGNAIPTMREFTAAVGGDTSSHVRAAFKKSCSDGNYGNESAECTLELDVSTRDMDLLADVGKELLARARRQVHEELRNSPSRAVQHAAEYREPAPIGEDDPEDLPY